MAGLLCAWSCLFVRHYVEYDVGGGGSKRNYDCVSTQLTVLDIVQETVRNSAETKEVMHQLASLKT